VGPAFTWHIFFFLQSRGTFSRALVQTYLPAVDKDSHDPLSSSEWPGSLAGQTVPDVDGDDFITRWRLLTGPLPPRRVRGPDDVDEAVDVDDVVDSHAFLRRCGCCGCSRKCLQEIGIMLTLV
jgi:hypothetical protein